MKRLLFTIASALVVLLLPSFASADKPTRTVFPPTEDFVTDVCGFDVFVDVTQDQFAIIEFFDKEGNFIRDVESGAIKWTLTNVTTDESIFVNLSGPGFLTLSPDGSETFVGTGPWIFFEDLETGDPELLLVTGKFEVAFDTEGNVEFSRVGRDVVDLCATLAA
jgi:hypothetical protein